MYDIKPTESRSDYIARCVPFCMKGGLTQKQALGKCEGMYTEHKRAARKRGKQSK